MESSEVIFSLYKDQPIYRDLLSDFVACLDERVSQSQVAYESRDWSELAKIMHKLCGAAATYGFPSLAEIAGSIEIASKAQDIREDGIRDSLSRVAITCKKIEAGMVQLQSSPAH